MLDLKNKRNSQRNEVIALAIPILLIIFFFMLTWSWTSEKSYGPTYRHPFADARDLLSKKTNRNALWRMKVKYRPESGMLLVKLDNKHNAPTKGLKLVAQFSPDGDRPAVLARLQSRSNGNYRSDNLYLDRGEWIMSVTGRRWSQLVFMLEQPFLVR